MIYSRNLAIKDPGQFPVALISPSAGVGLVWLASARSRVELVVDSIALVIMAALGLWFAAAVGWTASVPFSMYVLLVLAPVQYLVAVLLMRRWVPQVWGGGGRRGMRTLPEFGLVLLALVVGVVAYSVLRTAFGELLIPQETWSLAVGRGTRSLAAMATLGVVGLLARRLAGRGPRHRPPGVHQANRRRGQHPRRRHRRRSRGAGLRLLPHHPGSVDVPADAGHRVDRPAVQPLGHRHLLRALTGSAVIGLTIQGRGPLAVVDDPVLRAELAQLLVVVLMVLGMVISLSRRQVLDTVADLRRSEEANARRANELDLVMANLLDGVAIIEHGGRIVHANNALRTAFGTQEAAEDLDTVRPDSEIPDAERLIRGSDGRLLTDAISPLPRALAGESVPPEEWRAPNPEGPIHWVTMSAVPLPAEEGGPARAMIVLRDITAEKDHAQTLEARAAELNLVIDNLNDGLAIVEDGGTYTQANEALRMIFWGTPDGIEAQGDIEGPSEYHIFHPDGRPLVDGEYPYQRALRGITVRDEEQHLRRPDTPIQILNVSAFPLPDEAGRKRRAMVVVRDITLERSYQDGLASFAGTVAHDLNNPLSVIDGWAEAIQEDLAESEDPVAASAGSMVNHIRDGVEQMRGFISDLLAHAVARDQTLRCELVSLREHGQAHRHPARPARAARRRHRARDLPDVWADKLLVRQVLDNLIGNAIKYVAAGVTPTIRVERLSRPTTGWVEVRGHRQRHRHRPGAARARLRVLPPRLPGRVRRHRAGPGHLQADRRAARRHIRVESNPTGGSTFVFTLPATASVFASAAPG